MKTETQIKNKIFRLNQVRTIANLEANKLALILAGYVGEKVQKADNSFIKKIADKISFDRDAHVEPMNSETGKDYARVHYIYADHSAYSIYLKVSICFNGGSYEDTPSTSYCEYEEWSCFIGDVSDGILQKIDVANLFPIDEKKQIDLFRKAYKAKEQYETARENVDWNVRDWAGLKDIRI